MSVVHLPDELIDRLTAEAARRGISVDELAAKTLTSRFPGEGPDAGGDALEAFIGSGRSGGLISGKVTARSSPRPLPTRPPATSELAPVIVVDTGVLLAAADADDQDHDRCAQLLRDHHHQLAGARLGHRRNVMADRSLPRPRL